MESSRMGMPKYLEILNKYRVDGKPIGVEPQLYNHQFKKWATKTEVKEKVNKTNPQQITAEEAERIKIELQKIRERVKTSQQLLNKQSGPTLGSAVAQHQSYVQALRDKLNKINKQKIADALKVDTRVDHIKSAGQI